MRPSLSKVGIAILCFVLTTASCHHASRDFYYHVPEPVNDGLQVAAMEQVGLDTSLIIAAIDWIGRGKYGEIHSILLYKDDKLVLEEYFQGHRYQWDAPKHRGEFISWNRETPHVLQSASKSFVSICIGIAIEEGFIDSVGQSIFDYLPDYRQYNADNKDYVTIEHLLTMTSGFQWDEWHTPLSSVKNDAIGIYFSELGPVRFVLQRPLVAVPGTRFTYSGGDMQLLGKILENATGMNIAEFSAKYVFTPLGIESHDWWLVFPSGEISTGGGLKLTPRDMLKVGVLLLNDGVWNGQRILAEDWVEKCGHPFAGNQGIEIPGEDLGALGYGYTWWTKQYPTAGRMFCALGWGGQKIMVFPERDAVVVFTGGNYTRMVKQNRILEKYIFPAL